MSALPVPFPVLPQSKPRLPRGDLPDYLPARMVNEFVYCPRLYFYMWVEGLFRKSADTVEGSAQHKRVDARPAALPEAGESEEKLHARSVTLSSERLKVIAKLDLVEAEGLLLLRWIINTVLRARSAKTERWKCGRRIGCNLRYRQSCCARTDMNAMKSSCSTRRRGSGCEYLLMRR